MSGNTNSTSTSTSASASGSVAVAETANAARPTFSLANIVDSPGSSFAGLAAVFTVLSNAFANGFPTTTTGWIAAGVAVATGVGAILAKAGL